MLKLAVRTAGLRAGDGLALFANGATDVGRSPESFFDFGGLQTAVRHLWTGAPPTCNGELDEVSRKASGTLPDERHRCDVLKFE
jgi:hypothetical protein